VRERKRPLSSHPRREATYIYIYIYTLKKRQLIEREKGRERERKRPLSPTHAERQLICIYTHKRTAAMCRGRERKRPLEERKMLLSQKERCSLPERKVPCSYIYRESEATYRKRALKERGLSPPTQTERQRREREKERGLSKKDAVILYIQRERGNV